MGRHHNQIRCIRRWMLAAVAAGLVMATATAAELEERVVLTAENQQATEDTWHGEGGVHVLYQDIEIHCDELDYVRSTGNLVARGNVVVDRGPSRFTAEELRFNLLTKTGVFIASHRLHRPDVQLHRPADREAR